MPRGSPYMLYKPWFLRGTFEYINYLPPIMYVCIMMLTTWIGPGFSSTFSLLLPRARGSWRLVCSLYIKSSLSSSCLSARHRLLSYQTSRKNTPILVVLPALRPQPHRMQESQQSVSATPNRRWWHAYGYPTIPSVSDSKHTRQTIILKMAAHRTTADPE